MRWRTFYQNFQKASFEERVAAYSQAMEKLHEKYPEDHEAAAFYGLSLLAAAPPRETTFANQKKALALLNAEFPLLPDNPGIAHYIIHSCDSPQMAADGLEAAQSTGRLRLRLRMLRTCRDIFLRGWACGRKILRRTWRQWRRRRRRALRDMSCMPWTS